MKKFTIQCDFGGQMSPFSVFIGQPEDGHHPLHFQADWLSKQRGGSIPADVMDAISKLADLAKKNNVLLEELCIYALGTVDPEQIQNNENADTSPESSSSENQDVQTESIEQQQ